MSVVGLTIADARTRFDASLVAGRYAEATRLTYGAQLGAFVAWLGPDGPHREVRSVTPAVIDRYRAHLASLALAPNTVSLRLRALRRWFAWLVERGHLFVSPLEGLELPRERGADRLPEVLTRSEVERLLAALSTSTGCGVRDRALVELLYATGLRKHEVVALDVADVDLGGAVVRVRSGKGARGRVVPFGASAKRWLGEYVRRIRPQQQRLRPRERAFFLDRSGRRLSSQVVYRTVAAAGRAAGIEKPCHVHLLRHTCATHLVAGGADLDVVQRMLGHQRASTSQRYTRLAPVDLKREHDRTHPAAASAEGHPAGAAPAGGEEEESP